MEKKGEIKYVIGSRKRIRNEDCSIREMFNEREFYYVRKTESKIRVMFPQTNF